jgi:2-amino-4-hydroxy-6-hydroxymethyldihydropteridine diphosphokinase
MDQQSLDGLAGAVVVALGGNLPAEHGTVQALLESAVRRLDQEGLRVRTLSPWWRSIAWPDPADPPFLNAVALIDTALGAEAVIARLHAIEAAFGRRRSRPNAPRPLDLDLIAHGRQVRAGGQASTLVLPHPRAHERLFVMGPLAQIAPDWVHPVLGRTARDLAGEAIVGTDAQPL